MPMERVGLGGRLTFDESQAVAALKHASQTFDALVRKANQGDQAVTRFGQRFRQSAAQVKAGAQQMRAGFGDVGTGVRNLAIGMTPVAAAMGFGIAKAADFEQKMSGVAAITRASAKDLRALTAEAQRQGIVSVFSASESAEAMEFMGRAGFSTTEIIEGLGGVMAAAAAEGVDLATSADIVARVVRGMGLEARDAAHSADVLALTSAKTNTNLIALGESFKFGAPQAKAMGISVEETAAIFGKLADAGLRGSIGGTAFTNMMIKLSKPSKMAAKQMEQWGIKLTDASGALLPMGQIVDQFRGKIGAIRDTTQRAQIMTELFGIRGAKAYNALALAGGKALTDLTEDLEASSFGVGAAQEAADKRLNNFLGAFKLFGSSLEAASIEFFGPMMDSFKVATQDMTGSLNNVLFSIQGIKRAQQAQATTAERFAKVEAQGFAERMGLLDELGKRQTGQAKAALHALATEAIGFEKLSRAERLARNKALAGFVKENLVREKMSKEARGAELGRLDALTQAADEGRLTAAGEAQIRKRFFESLVAQNKTLGNLSREEQQREAAKLRRLLTQEAAQERINVEARALLERENELSQIEAKHGRAARLIAEGVMDALASIKAGFAGVVETIKAFGNRLRESVGEDRLRGFVKLATTIGVLGGALVPVAAGLGLFSLLVKGAIAPVIGLTKMVAGLGRAVWGLGGMLRAVGLHLLTFKARLLALPGVQSVLLPMFARIKAAALASFGAVRGAAIKAAVAMRAQMGAGLLALKTPFATTGLLIKKTLLLPLTMTRITASATGKALKMAFLAPLGALKKLGAAAAFMAKGGLVAALAKAKIALIGFAGTLKVALAPALAALAPLIWPIVAVGGALVGAFFLIRKEGESVGDTLTRIWGGIVEGAKGMWADFKDMLSGFWQDFRLIGEGLRELFGGPLSEAGSKVGAFIDRAVAWFGALPGRIGGALSDFATVVSDAVSGVVQSSLAWLNQVAPGVVEAIGGAVEWIGSFLDPMFQRIAGWASSVAEWIGAKLRGPWEALQATVAKVVGWIRSFLDTKLGKGLASLMARIGNVLTKPWRLMLQGVLKIADAVPGVSKLFSKDMLASVRTFAEEGFKPMEVRLTPEQLREKQQQRMAGMAKGMLARGAQLEQIKHVGLRREAVRQIVEGLGDRFSGQELRDALRKRGGNLSDVRTARALAQAGIVQPAIQQAPAREVRQRSLATITDMGERQGAIMKIAEGLAKMGRGEDVQKVITARGGTADDVMFARAVLEQRAEMRKEQMALQRKAAEDRELKANVEIQDSRSIKIDNKMCVDGGAVAGAMARHQQSITERSGGKSTPFMRRRMVESGVKVAATAQG